MMKCQHCGNEMNAFREIKQVMSNEGFSREYIESQIRSTISAAVQSAVGESLKEYLSVAVRRKIDNCLYERTVQDAIKNAIGDAMQGQFIVKLKEKPKNEG